MSATTMSQLAGYKGWSLGAQVRRLASSLRSPWRSFRRRLLHKPGSTLAITAAFAFAGAILTNALAFQTERHPSPMFTALGTGEPTQPAQAAAVPAPVPPARPAQAERQKAEAPPAPKARAKDEVQRTASISGKDQIAAIIADAAGEKAAPATPSVDANAARILLVQKALNKAGFGPLKEDGAFGAGTRRALERFEADRKLAVRGEPNGRVLKELARASGLAIN